MQELWYAVSGALGLELEARHLTALQMVLRACVVFVLSIGMLKVGDKRFMGKSTTLDVMLGIVFGSTVSRAITGNAPFLPALRRRRLLRRPGPPAGPVRARFAE